MVISQILLAGFPGFPLAETLAFGFQRFLAGFQIFFSCVKVAHALGTLGALTGKPICNDGVYFVLGKSPLRAVIFGLLGGAGGRVGILH